MALALVSGFLLESVSAYRRVGVAVGVDVAVAVGVTVAVAVAVGVGLSVGVGVGFLLESVSESRSMWALQSVSMSLLQWA